MKEHLDLAIEAAREAGGLLNESSPGDTVHVGRDVKLDADRLAENLIIDRLTAKSPFGVLAEESGTRPGANEALRWIVDPLDGSMNFLRGIPLCCVSIALCRGTEPVLGVVYDFWRDEMFTGAIGHEAKLNGTRIHVSGVADAGKAVLCTGIPVSADFSLEGLNQFIVDARRYKKIRLLGSAALSLAYVAAGRADAYQERNIKIWDVAAGVAIVEAAGGRVSMAPTPNQYAFNVSACNGNLD